MSAYRRIAVGVLSACGSFGGASACQYVSGLEPFSAAADASTSSDGPPASSPALLYTFDEGSGTTARDRGGSLDLEQVGAGELTWLSGGVSIPQGVHLASAPATALTSACNGANAFTVSVWIRPTRTDLGGPASVVTLSEGSSTNPSFGIGVELTSFVARVGGVSLSGGTVTAAAMTHVVLSRAGSGAIRLFVDGAAAATATDTGALSWRAAPLAVADEPSADRPWEGEIHRLSIYCRALDAAEVKADFVAGP